VTVPCQSVAVWAVGRAVCAQCSGCLVAAASLYRCWRDLHVRITTHESTQFACSLVQTALFPRHRGIPRHLRKFRGVLFLGPRKTVGLSHQSCKTSSSKWHKLCRVGR